MNAEVAVNVTWDKFTNLHARKLHDSSLVYSYETKGSRFDGSCRTWEEFVQVLEGLF